MMAHAIESVRFRLKPSCDEATFLALNERAQSEIAPRIPGLLRREVSRSEDGWWLIIVLFADMASAKQALPGATATGGATIGAQYMDAMDPATLSIELYTIVDA